MGKTKKSKLKALKAVLIIIVILIVTVSALLHFKFRKFLTNELSKSLNRQVFIGRMGIAFPLNIYFNNLSIFEPLEEGKEPTHFIKVDRLIVYPSIVPIFKGRIMLRGIYLHNPLINIVKKDATNFNFSDLAGSAKKGDKISKPPMSFIILGLKAREGQINFTDLSTKNGPAVFNLKRINLDITRLVFPLTDIATEYKLEAELQDSGQDKLADINSSGWINFTKKDMDAQFDLKNLPVKYFEPYYKNAINGEIKSGIINLNSKIVSVSNDLTAKCKLDIRDLKIDADGTTIFGIPTETFIALLESSGGNLSVDFEIKTKLDRPQVKLSQVGKDILNKVLEKVIKKSPQIILNIGGKAVGSGGEEAKEIDDTLKAVGEGLKSILGK